MPGIMYGKDWREKRDKIVVSWDDVRKVHRHAYKAADLVIEKHPELKKIITTHAEKQLLGRLIIEKGGGKNRSQYKDWGVSGVTDIGDIAKTMAQEKKITPLEARKMAVILTEATGKRKRELVGSLTSNKIFHEKTIPAANASKRADNKKSASWFGRGASSDISATALSAASTSGSFIRSSGGIPKIISESAHGIKSGFLAGVRSSVPSRIKSTPAGTFDMHGSSTHNPTSETVQISRYATMKDNTKGSTKASLKTSITAGHAEKKVVSPVVPSRSTRSVIQSFNRSKSL
ncbi:MAG: hypothetical protein HGB34_02670 [Candidatus Moranbacteria bacterium]|nr:hypothetical protein [Candidatus Moranbacteria bacterium]